MNKKQTLKGFTIIEVVLVLAIAGLIFLMVFVALPALQAGQRDTARKQDVGTVSSAVTSYTNNNRGDFPDSGELQTQLVMTGTPGNDATFENLSTNINDVTIVSDQSGDLSETVEDGQIVVFKGYKCDTVAAQGSVNLVEGTVRQFATIVRLEGGNQTGYCLDS